MCSSWEGATQSFELLLTQHFLRALFLKAQFGKQLGPHTQYALRTGGAGHFRRYHRFIS
jgi:hypothetical protein